MASDGYDKQPQPSNKAIEDAFIGSMLYSPESAIAGLNMVVLDDFYHPDNRVVISVMLKLSREGREIDISSIMGQLFEGKLNDRAGGVTRLYELQAARVNDKEMPHYAKDLREKTLLRRVISQSRATLHQAYAAEEPASEIIANLVQASIANIEAHGKLVGGKLTFDEDLELIKTWQHGEGRPALVPFGFRDLDSIIHGGMMPGEMTIVAARTGVGKTSFGTYVCLDAARVNLKVAMFSLEMSSKQIRHRMLSQLSGVPEYKFAQKRIAIKNHGIDEKGWEDLKRIARGIKERDIWITDEPYLSTSQIRLRIQQAFTKKPPDLILIDHLTKIKPHDPRASLYEKSGLIASDLKNIAKEFGCVVLALSQFGRQADKADRPRLSDIRESGKIEEEAATVVAIHRKPSDCGGMEEMGEFVVLKSRYSGLGIAHFRFNGQNFTFQEKSFRTDAAPVVDHESYSMSMEGM